MATLDAEVAELRERLERLERVVESLQAPAAPVSDEEPRRLQFSDKAEVRRLAAKMLRAMGIPEQPTLSVKELHELMIREGVRPEDRVFSTTLAEMRREKE